MRFHPFSVRLDVDEFVKLTKMAKLQHTTAAALARLFIAEGLSRHDSRAQKIQETLDFLVELVHSNVELTAASVASSSLLSVKAIPGKEGETTAQYETRYFDELKASIHSSKKLGSEIQKVFAKKEQ